MQRSAIFKLILIVAVSLMVSGGSGYAGQPSKQPSGQTQKREPKPKGPIRITAQYLKIEKKTMTSYFRGNVVVRSPQYTLTANEVNAEFDQHNEVTKVHAKGNVHVVSDRRTGSCREATYIAKEGLIILDGNALIKDPQEGSISAREIYYYLDDERVIAKGAPSQPTTIIYGLDGKTFGKSETSKSATGKGATPK